MSLLARRYATALLLAAKGRAPDGAEVRVLERELAGLHAAVADPAVRAVLLSPDVSASERAAVAGKLVAGKSELLQNLVQVVLRRRRQEVLFGLQPEFRALVLAERGQVEGVVETPRPLGDDEVQRLAGLAERLTGKQVTLAVAVVPELIGGVRLRVGNTLYDGSVRAALEQLEQQLLQAPV